MYPPDQEKMQVNVFLVKVRISQNNQKALSRSCILDGHFVYLTRYAIFCTKLSSNFSCQSTVCRFRKAFHQCGKKHFVYRNQVYALGNKMQ